MRYLFLSLISFLFFQVSFSQTISEVQVAGIWKISGIKFTDSNIDDSVKKDMKSIFKKATLVFNADQTFQITFDKRATKEKTKKYTPVHEHWILQDGYISVGTAKNHFSSLNFGVKEDKGIYFTLYGMNLKVQKLESFDIAENNLVSNKKIEAVISEVDELKFSEIEKIPLSRACDPRMDDKTQRKCTSSAVNMHFKRKFDTELAADLGIEGIVKIETEFVISTSGKVIDIVSTGGPEEMNSHVVSVAKKLPLFIPGYLEGKPVEVTYKLPITFQVVN